MKGKEKEARVEEVKILAVATQANPWIRTPIRGIIQQAPQQK